MGDVLRVLGLLAGVITVCVLFAIQLDRASKCLADEVFLWRESACVKGHR